MAILLQCLLHREAAGLAQPAAVRATMPDTASN